MFSGDRPCVLFYQVLCYNCSHLAVYSCKYFVSVLETDYEHLEPYQGFVCDVQRILVMKL